MVFCTPTFGNVHTYGGFSYNGGMIITMVKTIKETMVAVPIIPRKKSYPHKKSI